jgi:hypothetical protein
MSLGFPTYLGWATLRLGVERPSNCLKGTSTCSISVRNIFASSSNFEKIEPNSMILRSFLCRIIAILRWCFCLGRSV